MLAGVALALASPAAAQGRDAAAFVRADLSGPSVKDDTLGVTVHLDLTYAKIAGFRPLKLDLYQPSTPAPRPAILWVHGGGWAFGDQRASTPVFPDWPAVLRTLAARGYTVMAVSYRLSGEAKFPAAAQDIKAAIRWARLNAAALGIDAARIGIWGESAGGQLAALAGTSCGIAALEGGANRPGEVSSCVQAVVDWYGPTDFSAMDRQAAELPGSRTHGGPGAESDYLGCILASCAPETVQAANPVRYIGTKTPPFLIMHGDADRAVPFGQSRLLYNALLSRGSVEIVAVKGADHMFRGATDGRALLERVFAFLDKVLVPKR